MSECLDIPASGICLISLSNNSDHQNTLYAMFRALRSRGYEVSAIGAKNPVASNAPHTHHNFYVDCPARPGVAGDTFNLVALHRLIALIRSTGCRTVYFESVHLWNCVIMALLGRGYTKVTTLHDVVPHDGSKTVLLCQKLQCMLSDYVVIKSVEFAEDCTRLYGVSPAKIVVVSVWRDWPAREDVCSGDGSCLFFGRLRAYKGLPAMERIIRSCKDVRFTVMGAPDAESASILDAIKTCSNVKVVDREVTDEEMREAFRSASWVLLPYESASQSGVIIDAYSCGKPVVAFNVGAVGSQVKDGITGFLVPAGDIEAFVSAVERVSAMDRVEYRSFCSAAFEHGRALYAVDEACERFARLFNVRTKGAW